MIFPGPTESFAAGEYEFEEDAASLVDMSQEVLFSGFAWIELRMFLEALQLKPRRSQAFCNLRRSTGFCEVTQTPNCSQIS